MPGNPPRGTPTNLWVDANGNIVDREPIQDLQRAQQELLREMETTLRTATVQPFRPTIGRVRPPEPTVVHPQLARDMEAIVGATQVATGRDRLAGRTPQPAQAHDFDFWGFDVVNRDMKITINRKGKNQVMHIPDVVLDDMGTEDAKKYIREKIENLINLIMLGDKENEQDERI